MKKINLNCTDCGEIYDVNVSNEQASNGAWKRYYMNKVRAYEKRCYKCLRRNRESSRNKSDQKKYIKTKKGFLVRLYRNMKSRVTGIQKKKAHLYKGKTILTKDVFYKWANGCKEFHEMFSIWEKSEYDRKLTPTVDRIDSDKGYELENMQWLTHSENSRKGACKKAID